MRRKDTSGNGREKQPRPRGGKAPAVDPRERIRQEATRLIAQRGFGAISVNDVAQAVGISKQALLYHYPSREALHEAVLASLVEHSNRHLLLLIDALTGRGKERLERAIAQIREFFDADPHVARVILREMLDGNREQMARLLQGVEPWMRLLADVLRQEQREGRVRQELDPDVAVEQVGSLLLTTFALHPVEGWTGENTAQWRERRLSEVVRIIEHYLFTETGPEHPASAHRQTE